MSSLIEKAVILTQSNRPRFQADAEDLPIALKRVCSVPLIKRQLDGLARCGIKHCTVIIGDRGEMIRRAVEKDPNIRVQVDWQDYRDWQDGMGGVDREILLLKSDHLFQVQAIQKLLNQDLNGDDVIMAVDSNLKEVVDVRIATKVKHQDSKIQNIGDKLNDYNAVDAGMYLCKPEVFAALGPASKVEKSGLGAAFAVISKIGKLQCFDLQGGWWFDLDTPGNLERAETVLLETLRKSTDGFISRNLNRPLSLRLSRLLMNTPITGNHITYLSLFLGLVSSFFFSLGTYGGVLTGAILFQILSILDGCDGELAKLKLQDTKKGQLLDTVIDHITYLVFFAGIVIGYYRQQHALWVIVIGCITILNAALGVSVISRFAKRTGNWSFVVANQTFYPEGERKESSGRLDLLSKFFSLAKFAVRRDFFAFATLVAAIFGGLAIIYWVAFVATLLYVVGIFYGKSRYIGDTRSDASLNRSLPTG